MVSYQIFQMSGELVGAIFTFFCACAMFLEKKLFPKRGLLLAWVLIANTALLVSDALAIGFRGNPSELGYYMVRISNFLVFALSPAIILLAYFFIVTIIESHEGQVGFLWTRILCVICAIHFAILLVTQFTGLIYYFDEGNYYHRADGFPLTTGFALIELFIVACLVIIYRQHIPKTLRGFLLLYILMPVISAIIQTFYYGFSFNNIAATVALMLLFLTYQLVKSSQFFSHKQLLMQREMDLKDQELLLSKQRKELAEAQLLISLSQMQPHFMFNTLGSIEQLCKIDSKRAVDATHYFAQYLRNNLLAMNTSALKPFTEELNHIHAYVWLEQMRFGEDLEYEEDIRTSNFMLPLLSIQPLVENSINLGMRIQEDGVIRIQLKTYEDPNFYHVKIADNLKALPPDIFSEDSFEKAILPNINNHLNIMCHGSLNMTRYTGLGRVFHLLIPKEPYHPGSSQSSIKPFD